MYAQIDELTDEPCEVTLDVETGSIRIAYGSLSLKLKNDEATALVADISSLLFHGVK